MERPVALVVDRDASVRALVADVLEERGMLALGAESVADARQTLADRAVSLLLVELDTPATTATLELVEHARKLRPQPLVVGIGETSRAVAHVENVEGVENAENVESVRSQLFDVTPRPVDRDRIERLARRSLSQLELLNELRRLQTDLQRREGYVGIVGRSEPMERIRQQIERLAWTDDPVWITGEDGTGKELVARSLHESSPRSQHRFVLLDCAELVDTLSLAQTEGPLDRAAQGTLYIEDLPALRVDLQDDLAREIGRAAQRDVRLVLSSRVDPPRAVEGGHLSKILYDRLYRELTKEVVRMPPLRDRVEDIAVLSNHFLEVISAINHLPPIRISPDALTLMERYGWPGNVQELRNAVEQAVILGTEGTIRPADLPDRVREAEPARAPTTAEPGISRRPFREVKREVVEAFERAYLSELLERHAGNVTAASQQAGMLRSALQRLLRKYGLKSADFRSGRRAETRRPPSESVDDSR